MFHMLPLSSEEIRTGILFTIGDAIDAVFTESAKKAGESGTGASKEMMTIHFENSSTNPLFFEKFEGNVQDVLFLNDAAKQALSDAGVKVKYLGSSQEIPDGAGLMMQMPRFI